MHVHVVIGWNGEYSDREEWVAGVFEDFEVAKRLVIGKTAAGRQRANDRQKWMETRRRKVDAAEIAKLTPELKSYYGFPMDHVRLTVEEMAAINAEMGPFPEHIEYADYYIVCVPMNEWGEWRDYAELRTE